MSKTVKLVRQGGETSNHIDVRIEDTGDLLLSGQDIGEAPQQIFGKDDYEYWLTVPATEKDRVLLALIEKVYRGNASVVSEFREFLESKNIPCHFHSY
jgi:hypothetical protein